MSVFGNLHPADKTRAQCQHLYYQIMGDAAFTDIPYDTKIDALEMIRVCPPLKIPDGAFPLAPPAPTSDIEGLQERTKTVRQRSRESKLIHTKDVTDIYARLQNNIYDPDFLESALGFQPDLVKWKALLEYVEEDWGLKERDFLSILDDYIGDSSEELTIQQIRAMEPQPVEWLIDGFLTLVGMSTFVAPPKAGRHIMLSGWRTVLRRGRTG
jgi:hypothetical protein